MKRTMKDLVSVVYPKSAGIDVAKDIHVVALPADARGKQEVRTFGGFTKDLQGMAEWLRGHGIEQVALESTGVYWISLYEVLDTAGFDVWLVNPAGLSRPDRRKSDVLDCQWIQQLMSLGMLKRSHRPADRICELRGYVRGRRRAIAARGRCVQHMQKALLQMNLKLDSVLSDIAGRTGMRIIRAIVAGERCGETLAKLRHGRVRADEKMIAAALQGNWRAEHLFALEQALDSHRHYEKQIRQLEERIEKVVSEMDGDDSQKGDCGSSQGAVDDVRLWKAQMRADMQRAYGVDLMGIPGIGFETVLTILSEVGSDFSAFPTARHFGQWLGLAPGTNISGGKRLSGAKSRGCQATGQALRMAAMTLRRDSGLLGSAHRSRCVRMDPPRAVKATAYQLARIIYSMVTNRREYSEVPMMASERSRLEKRVDSIVRQAGKLGLQFVESSIHDALQYQAVA